MRGGADAEVSGVDGGEGVNQMKENDMMDTHSEEEDKSKEQEKSSTSGILEGLNAAEKALASTKEVRQALSSVFLLLPTKNIGTPCGKPLSLCHQLPQNCLRLSAL